MTMNSIVHRPFGKGLVKRMLGTAALCAGACALPAIALAQTAPSAPKSQPTPLFPTEQEPAAAAEMTSAPVIQEIPTDYFTVAPTWQVAQAQQLLSYIRSIGNEGLFAKDYRPDELQAAIAAGPGAKLNETATRLFTWVAEDLRDGRTEMESRQQWFVEDPDWKLRPIKPLLEEALASGQIVAALDSLNPGPIIASLAAQ